MYKKKSEKFLRVKLNFQKFLISTKWGWKRIRQNEIFPLCTEHLSNSWNRFKGAELSLKIHLTKFPVLIYKRNEFIFP